VVVGGRRNVGYWLRTRDILALRLAARLTTHVVANSSAAARVTEFREGVHPGRISVIPNMLDTEVFHPALDEKTAARKAQWGFPEDAVVVGVAANLRPVKNLELLVHAAGELAGRFPKVRFVVLGEGPDRIPLERLIRSKGLERIFALPGHSEDIASDIRAFDLGALVSRSESSPNALLEYMACGKASVVSDVGGVREIAVDGRTALIFPEGDLRSLVANLGRLLEDPSARAEIGSRAREQILAVHDQHLVIHKLESLYIELLGNARAGRHCSR
jgi:glycosyltransferase involved in cell wall biosynthesis